MDTLTSLPVDLARIPHMPPTAAITGVRTGKCTDQDLDRRTGGIWDKVSKQEPVPEFNRMWSRVTAQDLIGAGYLPSETDHTVWMFVEPKKICRKPLSEKLPDGRFVVNPEAITIDDINRFNDALQGGQSIFEDSCEYIARCIRTLIGTTTPQDMEALPYRKAVKKMLVGALEQSGKEK